MRPAARASNLGTRKILLKMGTTGNNRKRTSTSSFGTNGRISHDSSAYYRRALQPKPATMADGEAGENPVPAENLDRIFVHSSEAMTELPDRSVHLMVTSPPYNVGKEYDQDLTLDEHRALLRRVLAETYRVLAPGGRACVNVANLGRKPYIPIHSYVIEDATSLGFQMRGEVIWDKGPGAGVSTAWGSWCSPSNPTLRDTHEYILVFCKMPFARRRGSAPASIEPAQFLEYTKSVWTFGPESARRVGHPAPFPVELPHRLIQLYTFLGDVVLDPFMGTGATAVAATRGGRRFVGYELSEEYAAKASARLGELQLDLTPR
jgi:site-specific DNA-methyltransferase (adenine-specific)